MGQWQRRSVIGMDLAAPPVVVVFAVALLLAVTVGVGLRLGPDARRYFGPLPPIFVVAGALVGGFAALRILDSKSWIPDDVGEATSGQIVPIFVAVIAFAAAAILADITIGFDEDINVGWPGSLAFYGVMAVVAEALFHLVPLAIAALIVGSPPAGGAGRSIVVALFLVASIEAVFQSAVSRANGDAAVLTAFVAVHLLLFGLVQMAVFWQFGPWAMLLFRLAYYVLWHVGWGHVRLRVLF